ncbi:uncharacterized protein LOC109435111 [Rhinolophus sinicus]|uniref:uncharacterized protein LOC109435111 n=1 Tax=Rhinolophus sinicus TaxID=89399 RepID=UPI003D7BBFA6
MRLTWHSAPSITKKENQLCENKIGPPGSVRMPLRALLCRHPKPGGHAAPGPRRRPHLPEEAAAGSQRREGAARPRPLGGAPLALRRGQEPGAGGPVHVVGDAQPPPIPARGASPRRAPRRPHLPRALPQLGERLHPPGASAAPPARHSATPRSSAPAALAQADAGRPCSTAAAAGFVARPPTANLLRSLSRPLRLRSAASAPQQHGGRSLRRKPGGGEHFKDLKNCLLASMVSVEGWLLIRGQTSSWCNQKMEMTWMSGMLGMELSGRARVPAANFIHVLGNRLIRLTRLRDRPRDICARRRNCSLQQSFIHQSMPLVTFVLSTRGVHILVKG